MDPTAEELSAITSVGSLLDWVGLADEKGRLSRTTFLNELGNPKFIRQLVAVPMATYVKMVQGLKITVVETSTSRSEPLTPIEEGQMGEVRRVARLVLKLSPEADPVAPPSTAPGVAAGAAAPTGFAEMAKAIREAVRPPTKRILASKVLDQGDDSEVPPLDAAVLKAMIEDWKILDNDGEEPAEDEEATAEQLASLSARIATGATPFVDFGVWRPFGQRMERAMKFVVHLPQFDGTSRPKEISGPASFSQWLRCWKVYLFSMGALKAASRTRMNRYAERIRGLAEDYPHHWWVIGLADIKMRSEGIERTRRDCVSRSTAGTLKDFDPGRPWDVAFREAAADTTYWHKEVDRQISLMGGSLKSSAMVKDLGTGPIEEVAAGSTAKGGKPATWTVDTDSDEDASGKKKKKRQRQGKTKAPGGKKPKAAQGPGPGPQTVNNQKADEKTPEGKYLRDTAGRQLCWAFQKGNCQTPCEANRSHRCEWCRETHASSACPRGARAH